MRIRYEVCSRRGWNLICLFFLDSFKVYENEDDATKDLAEFSLANAIYAALVEGHACEQSARYDSSDLLFIIFTQTLFIQPECHGQCF